MSIGLKQDLLDKCIQLDIPLMGVASADRWSRAPFQPWVPEDFHPRSIYPEVNSVVVIGLPISLPILETSPSIYYHEQYTTANNLLDQYAYRLSVMLTERGHPSIYVPRDGYGHISVLKDNPTAFFSHRHAAYLAGLGSFGVSNMLLTKKYGPRVRFTSIFTTAELPADPIMDEVLCTRCMQCVRMCPAKALQEGSYPEVIAKKELCAAHNEELSKRYISPCGFCIKVCPVGEDRALFQRKDVKMYRDAKRYPRYHRAWEHVRSYGGR